MWLLSECLAINIFRNSDQKSIETFQKSDRKSIETSRNSDQNLFSVQKCSPAYTHEAVCPVGIATVVDEGGVSVSGFIEGPF